MGRAIDGLEALQARVARRAEEPSQDRVAGQLAATMGALVETARMAAASELAAEHSDSHGRIRAMRLIGEELEVAAQALDRAGGQLLAFYFETR